MLGHIDNPGFFIQMGMASMPGWLEGIFDRKYPHWKHVDLNEDGSCASAPAGLRVLEEMLKRAGKSGDRLRIPKFRNSESVPGFLR